MTREELLKTARATPDVGTVKHEEFLDYIVCLRQRKKVDDEWTTIESPYLSVDGRLAMAREDHRRQGKRLFVHAPQVLVNDAEQVTLAVSIESEVYGLATGTATSRKGDDGAVVERQHPWEIAETSAIGRALAEFGYGLFPGSGLASAEDMIRAGVGKREDTSATAPRGEGTTSKPGEVVIAFKKAKELTGKDNPTIQQVADVPTGIDYLTWCAENMQSGRVVDAVKAFMTEFKARQEAVLGKPPATNESDSAPKLPLPDVGNIGPGLRVPSKANESQASRPRSPLSAVQRRKLIEFYRNLHGGSEEDAVRGLDALFIEGFKHGTNDASYEEGSHITAQLLAAQRAR